MLIKRFEYFSKRAIENVKLNAWGAFMTVTLLTMFLMLLGISFTAYTTGQQLLPSWATGAKAIVYLQPEITRQKLEEVAEALRQWPEIRHVDAIPPNEARKRLEPELGEWKGVLEGLPEDFLPPSLEIVWANQTASPAERDALIGKMRQFPEVEEVFYGKSWAERLEFSFKLVRSLWLGGAGLLACFVVLTAFNSTRLALAVRREEVEICGMLGATPLFTKIPFYLESVFLGSVSGISAIGLLAFALASLKEALPGPMPALEPWHSLDVLFLAMGLFGCGVALSLLGSWLALRRTIKAHGLSADTLENYEHYS